MTLFAFGENSPATWKLDGFRSTVQPVEKTSWEVA
jgi:hypothetical protein